MTFSDRLVNQFKQMRNLFQSEEIKNLVKTLESDDDILDRIENNEISFPDFSFL